jgi:hypothetical protein
VSWLVGLAVGLGWFVEASLFVEPFVEQLVVRVASFPNPKVSFPLYFWTTLEALLYLNTRFIFGKILFFLSRMFVDVCLKT